ncbi:MAG: hypothetical protein K6T86_14875 [Pirellulales bacterium]|nr:hypothetical protein [Pirellulales bacterium]
MVRALGVRPAGAGERAIGSRQPAGAADGQRSTVLAGKAAARLKTFPQDGRRS